MKDIEFYESVYDILVQEAGAAEHMRSNFLHAHLGEGQDCKEYRFGGKLGFGGKYWSERNQVDCYKEDVSQYTTLIIDSVNSKIGAMMKTREEGDSEKD